ncbi:MAG: phage tail tape measure protein, partial [Pseudomonadota bacterium]
MRTMERVQNAIGEGGNAAMRVSERLDRAVGTQARIAQSQALQVAGIGASLAASLKPAIDFEQAMAGVKKVIGFDDDGAYAKLGRDIQEMTTRLPFAAEGLTDIVAAAGRAGLINDALPDDEKIAQLTQFAEIAAKMGTAFEISANDAGEALARWQQILGMTQDESVQYADALNFLANSMTTTERELVEITQRVGSLGELAGLSNLDFLALAASLSAAGAPAEIASTALKNMTNALTRGESATERQSEVLGQLGMDAVELAERMQVDAKGSILEVLDALAELPAAKRNAALGDLFGEEAKSAIGPLLTNIDGLRQAFENVSASENYA